MALTGAEPTMVPGYRHLPGHHCGSTALRNLLAFHGVEISEEMAFGLGAGACFYYVTIEDASPTRWFNGRTARLEENFDQLTGAALRMRTFEQGDEEAWEAARSEVDAHRPALLLTDLFHLDHYGNSAHFPGHAVVLAGYDDDVAYLSDTGFEELQTTRLESLARARHGSHPAYPLAGHMFTVAAEIDPQRLRAAIPAAIERAARAMLEPDLPGFSGLGAVERLAEEAGSWPEAAADWRWCARFGYQVIERRGTGGGAFRLMYSRFLEEAGRPEAPLAAEAAARWTELATAFHAASESDEPGPALWRAVDSAARLTAEAEERLWTALA
ncbi:MAG TPA: BtrH N-terminal domain-containing protein [Solirubrobacterales bacterium]